MRPIYVLFFVVILLFSCSSASRKGAKQTKPKTMVRVQNQNFLDMNIYVIRNTQRVRLGTARGLSTQTFVIPDYLVNGLTNLSLLADPIGGRDTSISEEISVYPGDTIDMVIPNL